MGMRAYDERISGGSTREGKQEADGMWPQIVPKLSLITIPRGAFGTYHYIDDVENIVCAEERRITSKYISRPSEVTQAELQDSPHYLFWRHRIL
jgi:hypothetical protein